MPNTNSTQYHRRSKFHQWIDGQFQLDPLAGGRDDFAKITVEFGSTEHCLIMAYIEEHQVPGMVTMFQVEYRGYRKRDWVRGPVEYEFQHRGQLMNALLGGGAV